MSRILLVEDEQSTSKILTTVLKTEGYKIATVSGTDEAVKLAKSEDFGLIIADISRGSEAGADLVKAVRAAKPATAVVLVTAEGQDISPLSDKDVFARIQKPLRMDDLLTIVQQALDYSEKAIAEMRDLSVDMETSYIFSQVVAESAAMRSVCDMASRIAAADVSVLISGEKGTGKSLVAHAIYEHSLRKDKKYVAVDCGTDDKAQLECRIFGRKNEAGVFESAADGTVFLAEIDALSPALQKKLLEVLQDKKVTRLETQRSVDFNVRILTSASGKLHDSIASGGFNPDLYKYLKAIVISVPPLRERPQDIKPLVSRFLRLHKGDKRTPTLEPEALTLLESYSWPGNATQLEEAIRQTLDALKENRITAESLPKYVRKQQK